MDWTDAQLAYFVQLGQAAVAAGVQQQKDQAVVDGLTAQITTLQGQLTPAQALVDSDQTASNAAVAAITAFAQNPVVPPAPPAPTT